MSGNPKVELSVDRLVLRNGLGSGPVTFAGGGAFRLTVSVDRLEKTIELADWTARPVQVVAGTLSRSQTWTGICHVQGGNIASDLPFVDPEHGDYRLEASSPCLGVTSPDSPLADRGCYQPGQD